MMHNIHFDILPDKQKEVWQFFCSKSSDLKQWNLYLAGGTALALQIGHRRSVDFDFFSESKNISQQIFDWLQNEQEVILRDQSDESLHLQCNEVKVSFIGGYKYGLISHLVDIQGVQLASIPEIGTMKLLAVVNRASIRDYIDMAVIIKNHCPLSDLLDLAKKKYGSKYNPMVSLKALLSFNDLDQDCPEIFDADLKGNWSKILEEEVRKIA